MTKHGWKLALAAAVVLLGVAVLFDVGAFRARSAARGGAIPDTGNFTLRTYGGQQWALADYRGKGPVLVNFFTTH